jgi:recombinational DNA repair protein RecT
LISKWGTLSVDYQMQKAINSDQAVIEIKDDGTETFDYVDNPEVSVKVPEQNETYPEDIF